jgi:cupin fold WbuC family metalloprotein
MLSNNMKVVKLGVDGWLQDLSAKSLSWYPEGSPVEISNELINCLEKRSNETQLNTRVCLHNSPDAAIHEMIICQRNSQAHPPKRHPARDKTFLVLRGELLVAIFNDAGEVVRTWVLKPKSGNEMLCVRIPAGVFHCDFALTETAVHLETTQGPFSPTNDREYLWVEHIDSSNNWEEAKVKIIRNQIS